MGEEATFGTVQALAIACIGNILAGEACAQDVKVVVLEEVWVQGRDVWIDEVIVGCLGGGVEVAASDACF